MYVLIKMYITLNILCMYEDSKIQKFIVILLLFVKFNSLTLNDVQDSKLAIWK